MNTSETSVCRERLAQFCTGDGLDLGCGGDLIVPHAIGIDLPKPYASVGRTPIPLRGDARYLHWFADNCLDFVFSSHLLEDFGANWTLAVLLEWQRVIKVGGHLVIYGPDEPTYRDSGRTCLSALSRWISGKNEKTLHRAARFAIVLRLWLSCRKG